MLPASILKIPYDILNRFNRNFLHSNNQDLVNDISYHDYLLTDNASESLDLFVIAEK
jgi:hypothetical protein